MNKKFKYYALIWAVFFAVFNVFCFATPNEAAGMTKFGGAFWAGYIFIILAFIGQLACAFLALKTDDKTKLFYNIPIIRVSYTGLILTVIFGTVCMAIPDLPNWVGIVVCLLILVFTAVAVIKSKAASEIAEAVDKKIKAQTMFIKLLTADAQTLLDSAGTDDAKAACKKVYEAARYSDPMSNDALAGIESQISLRFNAFSAAVGANAENIRETADELVSLIENRNRQCKLLK